MIPVFGFQVDQEDLTIMGLLGSRVLMLAFAVSLCLSANAQNKTPVPASCQKTIVSYYALNDQKKDELSADQLKKLHDTMETCVFDRWASLTKRQLSDGAYCLADLTDRLDSLPAESAPDDESQASSDAAKCHQLLSTLAVQSPRSINAWDTQLVSDTRKSLDGCILKSYLQLTKGDLEIATFVTGWLHDRIAKDKALALAEENANLKAQSSELSPATSQAIEITIATLPASYYRTLTIEGNQEQCTASGPQGLVCKKYVPNLGWQSDTYLIAMLATTKNGTTYLIGCPYSYNCEPLVPGSYPATMSGSDGIVISNLVEEQAGSDAKPHHGIYTILAR